MSKRLKWIAGWGFVIAGGALLSAGGGFGWGTTGAYITGGLYVAVCGATLLTCNDNG